MRIEPGSVGLQTTQNRIELLVRGERFASYRHGAGMLPGFIALFAAGERALTRQEADAPALWIGHSDVDGVSFTPTGAVDLPCGQITPISTIARRGSLTVGFQQRCAWLDPLGRTLLYDQRTIRVVAGSGEGRLLDLLLRFWPSGSDPVVFGRSDQGLLMLRAAGSLFPAGSGQVRNSEDDYGPGEIDGRTASWCACVGVTQGETVGLALLDHPTNPRHPPYWSCREDGSISPAPFAWSGLRLDPGTELTLRYRLHVYSGYVETGWADARLDEFSEEEIGGLG